MYPSRLAKGDLSVGTSFFRSCLTHGSPVYSPSEVDRIRLWVYYHKISIYPIFYLLKGDYTCFWADLWRCMSLPLLQFIVAT